MVDGKELYDESKPHELFEGQMHNYIDNQQLPDRLRKLISNMNDMNSFDLDQMEN